MKDDFLLISNGKAGEFRTYHVDEATAIAQANKELIRGQECKLYRKHSDIKAGEVQVVKTPAQIEIDEALKDKPAPEQPIEEINP